MVVLFKASKVTAQLDTQGNFRYLFSKKIPVFFKPGI